MSKATVYQLTDDDSMREGSFLQGLQKIGFRKVTFADGSDYGVVYTMKPDSEAGAGKATLFPLGLGNPLALNPR